MATPSMLQSGSSRDLFESWCEDERNAIIICDFAVQVRGAARGALRGGGRPPPPCLRCAVCGSRRAARPACRGACCRRAGGRVADAPWGGARRSQGTLARRHPEQPLDCADQGGRQGAPRRRLAPAPAPCGTREHARAAPSAHTPAPVPALAPAPAPARPVARAGMRAAAPPAHTPAPRARSRCACRWTPSASAAHADYEQTHGFLASLAPPHVVLVHGEAGEMMRLRTALERAAAAGRRRASCTRRAVVQTVAVPLPPRRRAAVVGRLAEGGPKAGDALRGVLMGRGRRDLIMAPADLPAFTTLNTGTVTHKQARVSRAHGRRPPAARPAAARHWRAAVNMSGQLITLPLHPPPGHPLPQALLPCCASRWRSCLRAWRTRAHTP